ncbi:MAG: putative ABC transporter permease subunit, partial [Candidatus Aenigmatarchaeota archaeon]
MKEGTLELFSVEIKQSYRGFRQRVGERPLMTAWFIILLIVGFWTMLMLVELMKGLEDPLLTLSSGDVLFTVFFVMMAKASVETVENTLRNEQLKHYFSAPISTKKIQFSRFLKVFWYNLLLATVSLSIVSILVYIFGFSPPVDRHFFYHLYLLLILAPIVGFNLGMMMHVGGAAKNIGLSVLYGQNITLVWLVLHSQISPVHLSYYLVVLCGLSSAVLFTSDGVFWEGWKNGTGAAASSSEKFHQHRKGDLLPDPLDPFTRKIAEKEIFIRWRWRESPASVGVTLMIGIGLIFFYTQLGPSPDLGLDLEEFLYPLLISISLFLAVTLQVLFPALSLFGREGKAFWLIKSLAVEGERVIEGKILAILVYAPVIPLIVALPLPILLAYPLERVLFLLLSSIVMILLGGGIGIWASVRYPNFDESVNGAPDVTTM